MSDERKKWKAERIIEDVEHYGKKLKAENQISDFNDSLRPPSNQSNGNLGLFVGSMFFLIILVFLGAKTLQNNEPSNPQIQPSNLQSLPIAP
jgi:hypothetical protein